MHAQKFQIRYSPVQDRVLIIVTSEDAQERVFGLTRRIVKRLVPGLRGIMGDEAFASLTPDMPFDPPTPKPAAGDIAQTSGPGASAAGGATGGEASATEERGDAASAKAEPTPPPPQPDIHLVTRLRIVAKSEGAHVLQISDTATTLNVPLNGDQIIQFTQGILTVLERSEWALDWDEEPIEPPTETTLTETSDSAIDITADSPSRYRH
ncbi:MAG: hypothetical protein HOI57_12420 [Rhodospirillaceae bacterium]|jgi:hypothetical protein|nr:hypothetical protein [Rhodospirillaceae bacterium]MBT5770208.1 hypothetical protein [Rhodospirillaceae bacterium]MBT6403469.1 hypothetical protein [Rhodospirillaceae bacterium]MBT6537265.1 hypothetical protein [Rhodospirillaceae bacterium]